MKLLRAVSTRALACLLAGATGAAPWPSRAQARPVAKNVLDLQATRQVERVVLREAGGAQGPAGEAELTRLNPAANAWFLLRLRRPGQLQPLVAHLENTDPAHQSLGLDPAHPGQLRLSGPAGTASCELWPASPVEQARRSGLPYAPLCLGRLYLRNPAAGQRSTLEATTEFLRDHVWGGEAVIGLVRRGFFQDAYVERAAQAPLTKGTQDAALAGAPPAATLGQDPPPTQALVPEGLGIELAHPQGLLPGQWVGAKGLDHVYVSVVQPGMVPPDAKARPALDAVEAQALSILVAFDLSAFELGFALGSDHPRLGWSARVPAALRTPGLPGPDGIDSAAPLVRNGMVSPALQARTVATFTGGFKREHGAFRWGPLAGVNQGSHYGFVEQGVTFSSLVPGLATLYVLDNGAVQMKTWSRDDERLLGRLRHARQNGVALVERAPNGGPSVTGALVGQWGPGNWSGSADEKLRSLRAGTCLVETPPGLKTPERRFLVYGYFSSATPQAMAAVFRAYGCRYAMHLDMNALEHTYLALYPRSGTRVGIEHLVQGMAALDPRVRKTVVPRFLGYPDSRDFFYLTTKRAAP